MKKAGKTLMTIGAIVFATACCALDTDGSAYDTVLLVIMLGTGITIVGYILSNAEEYFMAIKKRTSMLWRADAFYTKAE